MEIRADIPIPPPISQSTGLASTIRNLKVGQSFFLPVTRRKSLRYALWWHRNQPSNGTHKFVTRTVEENNERVVCCWRVEWYWKNCRTRMAIMTSSWWQTTWLIWFWVANMRLVKSTLLNGCALRKLKKYLECCINGLLASIFGRIRISVVPTARSRTVIISGGSHFMFQDLKRSIL